MEEEARARDEKGSKLRFQRKIRGCADTNSESDSELAKLQELFSHERRLHFAHVRRNRKQISSRVRFLIWVLLRSRRTLSTPSNSIDSRCNNRFRAPKAKRAMAIPVKGRQSRPKGRASSFCFPVKTRRHVREVFLRYNLRIHIAM